MKRYPILEVCARIEGHPVQQQLLRSYCSGFNDWQGLLERAEREGMAPLLRKHLVESEAEIPASVHRSLNLLHRRHLRQAEVRIRLLEEILEQFDRQQLTPMLLKGAALSFTLYPEPALRPMRDIDILFRREEAGQAQEMLRAAGFMQSASPIPSDHHHLPSLYKTVDDAVICIEIHRGLYPNCPPYYPEVDFDRLHETGLSLHIGTARAVTFGSEEMLHYLYQHALHAPLTYESFKLINIADITGFVETHQATLDWQRIREDFPLLLSALPQLHSITPWDLRKAPAWLLPERQFTPQPYGGWPHKRLQEFKVKDSTLATILFKTFVPSKWWLSLYYGADTMLQQLACLLWKHPRHVYWWLRLYRSLSS